MRSGVIAKKLGMTRLFMDDGKQVPVTVLRAKQREATQTTLDFTKSPTWSELSKQFKHGRDVYLPELTHFIPMQDPALVASYLRGDA